jgi:glycine dehydrogenase
MHVNMHKTLCIPHGGGGPGMGPLLLKKHLAHFVNVTDVTACKYGSPLISLISWIYIRQCGFKGIQRASQTALLHANYMKSMLSGHYTILFQNQGGVAHEFIIDTSPFVDKANIQVMDVAKRLQDYGFHAPTVAWPVQDALMIEPTECESKEEMDRYIEALISIRKEIQEVEDGVYPKDNNVLVNAPHTLADVIDPKPRRSRSTDDSTCSTSNTTQTSSEKFKWDQVFPYSMEKAVYPLSWLQEKKYWPPVNRLDDAFGDRQLLKCCGQSMKVTRG